MNRLNKTESAVFLNCMLTLFLKDPFFRLFTCHIQEPDYRKLKKKNSFLGPQDMTLVDNGNQVFLL